MGKLQLLFLDYALTNQLNAYVMAVSAFRLLPESAYQIGACIIIIIIFCYYY